MRLAESGGIYWNDKDLPPATTQGKTKKQNKPNYTWQILVMSCNAQLEEGGQMLRWSGQDLKQYWGEWEQSLNTLREPTKHLTWNNKNKSQRLTEQPRLKGPPLWCPCLGRLYCTDVLSLDFLIRFFWRWGFLMYQERRCVSPTTFAIHHKEMSCY